MLILLFLGLGFDEARVAQATPKAPFTVVAYRFYDDFSQHYINVESILIVGDSSQSYGIDRRFWNDGCLRTFQARVRAAPGSWLRVTVEWTNGATYRWNYRVPAAGRKVFVKMPF